MGVLSIYLECTLDEGKIKIYTDNRKVLTAFYDRKGNQW